MYLPCRVMLPIGVSIGLVLCCVAPDLINDIALLLR